MNDHKSDNIFDKDSFIDELKAELDYLRKKTKQLRYREEDLEDDLNDFNNENKKLRTEIGILEKELEMEKKEHEKTLSYLAKKESIANEMLRAKSVSDKVIEALKGDNKYLELELKNLIEEKESSKQELRNEATKAKFDLLKLKEEKNKVDNIQREVVVDLEKDIEELQSKRK